MGKGLATKRKKRRARRGIGVGVCAMPAIGKSMHHTCTGLKGRNEREY